MNDDLLFISYIGFGFKFKSWIWEANPQPYGSFGNGSAMRIAPVGWAFDSLDESLTNWEGFEKQKDGSISFPYPIYGEPIKLWIQAFEESGLMIAYDWCRWFNDRGFPTDGLNWITPPSQPQKFVRSLLR